MDSKYYVSVRPRTSDFHSVHKEGCPFLAENDEKIYLGSFNSDHDAEEEGKRYFIKSKNCPYCSKKKDTSKKVVAPELVLYSTLHYSEPDESYNYQSLFCCVN